MAVKIAPLATYPNEMEARMAAQLLESEGIPAIVKPLGGGYGGLGVTQFIHHRVYVPESDLDEAKKLMQIDEYEFREDSPGTSAQ